MPRLTETLNKEPLSKEGNPCLRAALNIEGSNAFEEPRTGPSSCMFARKLSLLRPFLGMGYTCWWVEVEWAHILPLTWDLTGVWGSLANPFNKDKHRLWQKPTISSGVRSPYDPPTYPFYLRPWDKERGEDRRQKIPKENPTSSKLSSDVVDSPGGRCV